MVSFFGIAQTVSVIIVILLVVVIILVSISWLLSVTVETSCKTDSDCTTNKICESGKCLLLPGYNCSFNTDCSSYAPVCSSGYCTNYSDRGRGTLGNPISENGTCNPPTVVNLPARLCQGNQGSACTKNSDCYQGLCTSGTCQYTRSTCGGDEVLNPNQCYPPLTCNLQYEKCVLNGITPGAPGSACFTNSDCNGGKCIPVPGTSYHGICASGLLRFLQISFDPSGGGSGGEEICFPPLTSTGENFCRYDIASHMKCASSADCQYPYPICSQSYCNLTGSVAGSDPLYSITGYNKIAYNLSGVSEGSLVQTSIGKTGNDYTGGRLLGKYDWFCEGCPDLTQLNSGYDTFSFSKYTSFTIASLIEQGGGDGTDVTIIYEDPSPVLVATNLIEINNVDRIPVFYLFRKGEPLVTVYGFANSQVGNLNLLDSRLPELQQNVKWFQNPIVNSSDPSFSGQTTIFLHSVMYDNFKYYVGISSYVGAPGTIQINPGGRENFRALVLTDIPAQELLRSWDAYSIFITLPPGFDKSGTIFPKDDSTQYSLCHFLFVTEDSNTGNNKLRYMIFLYDSSKNTYLSPIAPSVCTSYPVPIFSLNEINNPGTSFRIFRNAIASQTSLTFCMFKTVDSGKPATVNIELTSFNTYKTVSNNSTTPLIPSFETDGTNECQDLSNSNLDIVGISQIRYVSSFVGPAGRNGGFVIWGANDTQDVSDFMCIIQINATCLAGFQGKYPEGGTSKEGSSIFWKFRENVDVVSGNYPYYLYPIGGTAIPVFLKINVAVDFEGVPPNLPTYSV